MTTTLDPSIFVFDDEKTTIAYEHVANNGIISGPVGRTELDSHRWYIDPANAELIYESITTIIGDTTSKYALQLWSANVTAEASLANMNKLVLMMGCEPVFDADGNFTGLTEGTKEGREEALKWLKLESRRLREMASAIGVYQHDVLEGLILDSPGIDIPEELREVEIDGERLDLDVISDGLLNFFADFDIIPLMAEATVVNTLHMLGGTLDLMGLFPTLGPSLLAKLGIDRQHPIGIGDLKTGKHLYEKAIREQLNAYYRCDEVWVDRLGNKIEMPSVDFLFVLHLRKEFHRGYKFRLVPICEESWLRFLHRRAVIEGGPNDTKFVGTVLYPPLPDGSQPPPMIEDVPAMSRCAKKLISYGYLTLADFAYSSEMDLLSLGGVGPAAVKAIREQLIAHDLDDVPWSDDDALLSLKGVTRKIITEIREPVSAMDIDPQSITFGDEN